jgi:hypothetical protein
MSVCENRLAFLNGRRNELFHRLKLLIKVFRLPVCEDRQIFQKKLFFLH